VARITVVEDSLWNDWRRNESKMSRCVDGIFSLPNKFSSSVTYFREGRHFIYDCIALPKTFYFACLVWKEFLFGGMLSLSSLLFRVVPQINSTCS